MRRALTLAERGTGCTSPNPLVGCVIVRDGVVIGEGWHEIYGHAHAEVNALRRALHSDNAVSENPDSGNPENTRTVASPVGTAGGAAGGAADGAADSTSGENSSPLHGCTLYVTLEPCHHHGLTPPCTQAILDAGISTVVYALQDPNPKAAGGARYLADHQVHVIGGILESEARFQNRFFLKHVESKQPFVIAKSASSLDGKTATRSGHSQWITGTEAREKAHELRQQVDAILVGANTVLSDDPALTVRLAENTLAPNAIRHPRPVILDTQGRVSLDCQLLGNSDLPTRSIVATTNSMQTAHRHELEARGVEVITLPHNKHGAGVDPESLLNALGQRAIQSVLLEGGAALHGSFRDAGLIDEIWAFIAPMVVGGDQARCSYTGHGCHTLDEATELQQVHVETVGRDILIRGLVVNDDNAATRQSQSEQISQQQGDANKNSCTGRLDAPASPT